GVLGGLGKEQAFQRALAELALVLGEDDAEGVGQPFHDGGADARDGPHEDAEKGLPDDGLPGADAGAGAAEDFSYGYLGVGRRDGAAGHGQVDELGDGKDT